MKDQLFNFDEIPDSDNTWNLNFEGLTIISLLKNGLSNIPTQRDLSLTIINKAINNFYRRPFSHLKLVSMNQIIHQHGSKLLTWKQSKILVMLRVKGPVPFYFKILERLLLSTDNLL
jgi:hypothetical protein